jgi:PAS domain S-box-containing protein
MTALRKKPPAVWPFVVLFFVITLSAIVIGFVYYNYQKKALLTESQQELSAISFLKIRQITQWRFERIGDGKFLGDNLLLVRKFIEFLNNPEKQLLRNEIQQSLKSLTETYDYKSVLLVDTAGNTRVAFPNSDTLIGDHLRPMLPGIVKQREVVLTDLHKANMARFVHLDLIVPLIDNSRKDKLVIGMLALRIDPQQILYPLLQSWPSSSKSAETLLIRKDGDEIVYLNELRHLRNTALILKKHASSENLPAAMAIKGITGTIDGIDYRNVPVVASMNKVPGTPWYMVAKMDREEVLSSLNSQIKMIVIILILVILTTGSFLGLLIRNQRVIYYREGYENEVSRLALIKHFDYILKFANDFILLVDKDLNIVEANDRALEFYQYSRDEFIGMNVEEIRAPEALPQLYLNVNTVDENESATFETVHKRKDNSTFPIELSARVVLIEGSKYYQSIGRDITQRKNVENILRESENKFRKIFEESPFSMLMTAKDFGILKANLAFCNFIGYQEEELISRTFKNFTHPDNISIDEISLLKLIAGDIPVYHTEKRYLRKDGSVIWGSTTVSIIRNNNEEVQFFLVMIEDINLRKKTETDLIAAKEKAEENDRLKTAFLHNVSHEIRTPMNGIIGFSTLLNEPDLKESERRQYTDIIYQNSLQLLSIINDIVDIANVESGQAKINLSEFNLNAALGNLNEQFVMSGKENNVTITLETELADNDSTIMTDQTKLVQILSNLMNNAIKFTSNGKIDFGYVIKGNFLEFYVNDTGIGIQPEYHSRIFDRFFQVDSKVSRQYSGTGLGLSICKGYVELLGGNIRVESEPGKGTRFAFTIPYQISD